MNKATIHTPEWGIMPADSVVWLKCPVCKKSFHLRLAGDEKTAEMPRHGSTIDMDCPGGGKWYKVPDNMK